MKKLVMSFVVAAVAVGLAYLPPVDDAHGVRVEIETFPQAIERPQGNPFSWPLGVTQVAAAETGATVRSFPVTLANTTAKPVSGRLEVWLNDDWEVAGPAGALTLAAGERKSLTFIATAKPSALNALYPVHARFTPDGCAVETAPHPIAVFKFDHPKAPRSLRPHAEPRLGKGTFNLANGFKFTREFQVGKTVRAFDSEHTAERQWGTSMTPGALHVAGLRKTGFRTHPPYRKGAGVVWGDFPLELPSEEPIVFSCENFLTDPNGQPPSDGVDYKVFVIEPGKDPQLVAAQCVKKIMAWTPMSADLSAWAGRKITLRLWTGPGEKMNTTCDGGGWGDPCLTIGSQPKLTPADLAAMKAQALAAARRARKDGTDAAAGRWRLEADDAVYGAGVVHGPRGLVDGVLAFTDGEKDVVFGGFTAGVEGTVNGRVAEPRAEITAERGTLRVRWSLKDVKMNEYGEPRLSDLAIGAASERPVRVYAGFGVVFQDPKRFSLSASGFSLSTRHIGVDYANGLSVVQAVDVVPDSLVCDGEKNLCSLHAHHNATFTFVPSAKGSFAAARRFRAVSGYQASPGHEVLGSRMCLDQWGGSYRAAAGAIERAAKYGMSDSIFVKHVWQRWGYDYRLPEIYPPADDPEGFGIMREACRKAGVLFCPHDNYTDIYPDAAGYSYDLVVFNLDGTPQLAWFNPGRHARSYRWAPHAFHPWALRNAKLLKAGYDPEAIFIDVLTAHGPFDYRDRQGRFHSKNETSASWAKGFEMYREGFRNPRTVCVSEAGQDHLVGVADAGESDHFAPVRWAPASAWGDAERTPWHDIVTHGYYVLFAGGLGGRYAEFGWQKGGDAELHGYASDDYLSNCIIGGRNPMSDGPFSRNAVKTYWLQHDACAELGRAEFLDLVYEGGNIHHQHATFTDGGEVWINRMTNETWTVPGLGVTLPSYGYYAKTRSTTSGIVEKDGVRHAFAKSPKAFFVDARAPADRFAARVKTLGAKSVASNHLLVDLAWETLKPQKGMSPFVHLCSPKGEGGEGISFQCAMRTPPQMFTKRGEYRPTIDLIVPRQTAAGKYGIWFGAYPPAGGNRLIIDAAHHDGSRRICGGTIEVERDATRIVRVTWKPDDAPDMRIARDRLLGVNRAHRAVDFGGIVTDGSFRLVDGETIIPLPNSVPFAAKLELAAIGAKGRTLARVEALDPEAEAQPPRWTQTGDIVSLQVDSRAFAYRLVFQ